MDVNLVFLPNEGTLIGCAGELVLRRMFGLKKEKVARKYMRGNS
jgi:hypothetical protein